MELNKIYQGDCLELLKQVESESVDCIVTSPPYNKHSAKRKCGKTDSWQKANIDYGNFKDDLPEQEYQEQQKQLLRECVRVIKPNGSIFYNHKARIKNHKAILPTEWLGEFNRNLQVTPSASPKEATLPSVNSDIKSNLGFPSQSLKWN